MPLSIQECYTFRNTCPSVHLHRVAAATQEVTLCEEQTERNEQNRTCFSHLSFFDDTKQ